VALLDADVNLNVATDLIEQIRVKAVGTEVLTALSPPSRSSDCPRRTDHPAWQGHSALQIRLAAADGDSDGRVAGQRQNHHCRQTRRWLKKGGHRPMLVSVDVYAPPRASS